MVITPHDRARLQLRSTSNFYQSSWLALIYQTSFHIIMQLKKLSILHAGKWLRLPRYWFTYGYTKLSALQSHWLYFMCIEQQIYYFNIWLDHEDWMRLTKDFVIPTNRCLNKCIWAWKYKTIQTAIKMKWPMKYVRE